MSRRTRGMALLNALVIVAALSAVAVYLLQRAEAARGRLSAYQDARQVSAYLDGYEALARDILDRDRADNPADHLSETWHFSGYTVEIDRGRATGAMEDLQGRFNLNWLADENDMRAREAFDTLVAGSGLPAALMREIANSMQPDYAPGPNGYADRAVPVRLRTGPKSMIEELRQIRGMTPVAYRGIAEYFTVIPADSTLNVNTAPEQVIAAFFPEAGTARIARALAGRQSEPFQSEDDFIEALGAVLDQDALDQYPEGRFGVTSHWFRAEISASLNQTTLTRRVVFERPVAGGKARVAHRLGGR